MCLLWWAASKAITRPKRWRNTTPILIASYSWISWALQHLRWYVAVMTLVNFRCQKSFEENFVPCNNDERLKHALFTKRNSPNNDRWLLSKYWFLVKVIKIKIHCLQFLLFPINIDFWVSKSTWCLKRGVTRGYFICSQDVRTRVKKLSFAGKHCMKVADEANSVYHHFDHTSYCT